MTKTTPATPAIQRLTYDQLSDAADYWEKTLQEADGNHNVVDDAEYHINSIEREFDRRSWRYSWPRG